MLILRTHPQVKLQKKGTHATNADSRPVSYSSGPCRLFVSIQAGLLQAARAIDAGSVVSPDPSQPASGSHQGHVTKHFPQKQISMEKMERGAQSAETQARCAVVCRDMW